MLRGLCVVVGRPTVLVLSPNAGGHYFGALIAGICREVALSGGNVMLALTADPALSWVNPSGRLESDLPIGWAHADVVIALMGSVRESYLERVLDARIPVVTIGEQLLDERVPCALPDNVAGIDAAVDHLVLDHGHTRIGFIGHVAVPDVAERMTAFHAAMARHGLPVPDHRVHASPGADAASGEAAARRLLAAGDLPTALVIGTDANALGVLAAFERGGRPGALRRVDRLVRRHRVGRHHLASARHRAPAVPRPRCARGAARAVRGSPASASSPARTGCPGACCDAAPAGATRRTGPRPPAAGCHREPRAVAAEPIGHRP